MSDMSFVYEQVSKIATDTDKKNATCIVDDPDAYLRPLYDYFGTNEIDLCSEENKEQIRKSLKLE